MRCLKCGAENVEFARFCAECGAGLQEDLAEKKKSDNNKSGFDELISKHDKFFYLLSIAGGAILIIVGLVVSMYVAASDPRFFLILRILALLVLIYVIVVATIFTLRMWPLIKGSKAGTAANGISNETDKISRTQLMFADNKMLRLGGAAFTVLILLTLIVTAILPRAQFNFRGASVPKEIVYGDKITITADAENYGRAAGNYELAIFVDNVEVQNKSVLLEAGVSKSVKIDLVGDYQPGTYRYSLGLGAAKVINYENTGQFRVLTPAEFKIKRLSLIPNQFDFNNVKDTKARVEVENVGEASGSITIDLSINGRDEESRDINLGGESKRYVDFPISVEGPGLYTIAANGTSEVLEVFNIERPRNGTVIIKKISGGYGQLKIINNNDVDTVVLYSRESEPLDPVIAVYVHAKSSTTVRGIRDGIYITYTTQGMDWDSHSRRFIRNADNVRYEDTIDYKTIHRKDGGYNYDIWTLTLGDVPIDQAAKTVNLSPEYFPKMPE